MKRLLWPDIIRVVAIFLMVVLHVCVGYITMWQGQSPLSWWGANLIDSFTRMCVTLFVMLSGALLLGKKETIKTFYSKRLTRLIKPWLFWSLIYGVINFVQSNETDSITSFIMGTVWSGFWILPVLLGLYISTPFFSYLINKFGNIFIYSYLVGMGALLIFGFHFPVYFEYSFYFMFGYLLTKLKLSKKYLVISTLGMIFSWLSIAGLTYYLSNISNDFVITYYEYNTWPVALLSISSFVFIKGLSDLYQSRINKKIVNLITSLSKASFGIYFIHMLIFRTNINLIYFPSYIFIPIISMALYLVSYMIIKKVQSIKFLRQIVS